MKYSVIIPTKNNPEQVKRCIDSIPEREDIEILICDDNSDAEFLPEIKALCEERNNALLIPSDHSAWAGHARNMGADNAKGEWLIFSDSDDFFDAGFWKEIDYITEQSEADIIYFNVKGVYSDTLEPASRGSRYSKYVDDFCDGKKNAEERLRYYHMVPWGKVFRNSLIKEQNIRYDEVKASNDVMFNIKAGSLAPIIEAHKLLMYYVTVSHNSLTKKKDKELLRCRYEVLIRHYKYVLSLGKPQCAYNMLQFAIRYSKPYGLSEFVYYLKKMIKNRINPFVVLYKIGRYN